MPDSVTPQTVVDLFGQAVTDVPNIDREPLAAGLFYQLQRISLEEFVSYLTNGFEAIIDYANLCAGESSGQRISLLFNPHRLDTGTKRFPISLYQALKDERFVNGLARVVLLNKKKGATKDLLYASIGMGVQGTSYVQEFPPHVARDLALEYKLTTSSKVLDPCAGWGGRMLGFSVVVNSYTCCEPSTRTAAGLRKLLPFIQSFRSGFDAVIHEAPFEDVPLHSGQYDFAMTSPPYFDTEWYAPGEQANSFNRYATFDTWCEGFYAPLIHRTMAALKPGCSFVLNIGSRLYPLNDRLMTIAEGRYKVEKQRGRLSASNGLGKEGEGETFYEVTNPGEKILVSEPAPPVPAAVQAGGARVSALDFLLNLSEPDPIPETFEPPIAPLEPVAEPEQVAKVGPSAFEQLLAQAASAPPVVTNHAWADSLAADSVRAGETETLPDINVWVADVRARGHQLLTKDGKFFVSNALQLTDVDRAMIKGPHRPLIIAMAVPQPPTMSMAEFLGPERMGLAPPSWVAQAPPQLDGIHDIVINLETNGLKWHAGHRPVGLTVGTLDGGLIRFLPFAFEGGGNLDEVVVKEWARRELRGKHITNAATRFDVHMMREWGIDLEEQGNTVSDVQHYAALLDDNRKKFNLDALATDYLGGIAVERIDESRMATYAAHEVAARAEYQAILIAQLREAMWPLLDAEDLQRVRQLEDDVIYPVCHMEKNAAPIDRPLLKQWLVETERLQHEALWEVAKEVGFPVNPDSPSDWLRLFEYFHLPVETMTEKGKPSFTDKVLKGIDNHFIQLVRRAGKLASLRSKFLVAYDDVMGEDNLLRYSLHQLRVDDHGTVRGRFSASDKNIQQVMNLDTHMESFGSDDFYIRRLFIPGKGQLFLSADAAQIEFRIFAHLSGSTRLLTAYKENPEVSFHRVVEAMVKPHKADIPYTKVKSLNFLCVYGGGKTHAADFLELPQEVSDQFFDAYHVAFPEVRTLSKKAEYLARSRGYVRSLLGRRARFADPNFAYKALNAVIQPSAADIMKMKIVELHRERKSTGFLMRATVHDEVFGDIPDEECAKRVTELLNRQSLEELKVPILWNVKTGPHWAACK